MRTQLVFALEYAKMRAKNHARVFQSLKHIYNISLGRIHKEQIYTICGITKNCDRATAMLFIGEEHSAHQFASLICHQIDKINTIGTCLSAQVVPLLTTVRSEIVGVRVQKPLSDKFKEQGYLLLPNLSFSLDLRFPENEIIRRMSRRRRRDIKKVEALGYSCRISKGTDKDLNFFYWKMYLPHTLQRFGKSAYIKTFDEVRAEYNENGGILFVEKDDRPVSAILFRIVGKTLYALSIGLFYQSETRAEHLASQAVLLFLVKWAKKQGFESLDYGTSLPFFREGIFSYKKEWGMIVGEPVDRSYCALKVNSLNSGSLAFLQNNPFIISDNGLLKGVVFLDHETNEKEIDQLFSEYFMPRLSSIFFVVYFRPETELSNEAVFLDKLGGFSNHSANPLINICSLLQRSGLKVEVLEVNKSKANSVAPDRSQMSRNEFEV